MYCELKMNFSSFYDSFFVRNKGCGWSCSCAVSRGSGSTNPARRKGCGCVSFQGGLWQLGHPLGMSSVELISAGAAHSGPKAQGSHSVTAVSHSRENKCCWQGSCLGTGQGGAWETLYAPVLWESRHGRRCLLGQVLSEPHLITAVCQGFPGPRERC